MGAAMLWLVAMATVLAPWSAAGLRCVATPTASCSDQMPHLNLSREDCIVENYPSNSTECRSLDLRAESWSRRLGAVRLTPYVWTDDEGTPVTALNVSFLDVRWTRLVLRLSPLAGPPSPAASACRGLRLSPRALALHLSLTSGRLPLLHWHCPWCGHACEAKPFSLEYCATDNSGHHPAEYGRFLFTLPPHTYVGEPGVPFPYVEVSSLPRVHVRWPPPPPTPLLDGGALYSVATLVDGRRVAEQTVEAARGALEADVGVAGAAPGGSGGVSFSVRALLNNCTVCADVRTPPVTLERSADAPYVWAAAAVVAVVGAILVAGQLVWRAVARSSLAGKQERPAPTVLLVYRQVSAGHVAVVRRLAHYLRDVGGCRALLDEEDIPRCRDKDPLSWYSAQMLSADVALVVASPCSCPAPRPAPSSTPGVYGEAAAAAESLLGARLSRGGRCLALALAPPPHCEARPHLPPPARGLRLLRASRPAHLRRLLRRLHAGGGRRPPPAAVRSASSHAAARQLLRMARESSSSVVCHHHQEATEVAVDDLSEVPELREPDFASESPVPPVSQKLTSPVPAVGSIVDLQRMNLLGPDHSEEDSQEEEDDGGLREIEVTTWTSDGQPHTMSLQL